MTDTPTNLLADAKAALTSITQQPIKPADVINVVATVIEKVAARIDMTADAAPHLAALGGWLATIENSDNAEAKALLELEANLIAIGLMRAPQITGMLIGKIEVHPDKMPELFVQFLADIGAALADVMDMDQNADFSNAGVVHGYVLRIMGTGACNVVHRMQQLASGVPKEALASDTKTVPVLGGFLGFASPVEWGEARIAAFNLVCLANPPQTDEEKKATADLAAKMVANVENARPSIDASLADGTLNAQQRRELSAAIAQNDVVTLNDK